MELNEPSPRSLLFPGRSPISPGVRGPEIPGLGTLAPGEEFPGLGARILGERGIEIPGLGAFAPGQEIPGLGDLIPGLGGELPVTSPELLPAPPPPLPPPEPGEVKFYTEHAVRLRHFQWTLCGLSCPQSAQSTNVSRKIALTFPNTE